MDEFRSNFVRLCRENRIDPQESVVAQLRKGQDVLHRSHSSKSVATQRKTSGKCLDLSTTSLTTQTCSVLGAALASDRTIVQVKLADCMIGDEGAKLFLHGLCSNVCVQRLDLKGNNMRGAAAEVLGKLIRQNHTLKHLCLEWNCLGLDSTRFAAFTDGLAANNSLEMLDLRNNQLSHESAADLAASLQRNTILKALDLRWNNIGIVGGRSLIGAMQYNKNITELELAGNNIPQDVHKAIDVARLHNTDRASLSSHHQTREEIMTREIRQLKSDKRQQTGDLLQRIDQQNDQLSRTHRETARKIGQLQEALEERKTAFNALAAKLSKTEAELALAEQRSHDLSEMLEQSREENAHLVTTHQKELHMEKGERASSEGALQRDLTAARDRVSQLESRLDELEKKCETQQEQIYELKEELTSSHAENKVHAAQTEERMQNEKQRQRDIIRDIEHRRDGELSRLRQTMEDSERAYKERIVKLEQHRRNLEEELSQVKTSHLNERLVLEEQILETKKRVKEEEQQRSKHLEDKIRLLQNSKDDLQQHSSQQTQLVSELQAKHSNATLEIESLKRKLEELNREVAGKNNELLAEVNKVEIQHSKQLSKLQHQLQELEDTKDRCDTLEKQLSDQARRYRSEMHSLEAEADTLKEKLRLQDMEFGRLQEEEAQKASQLHAAISSFLTPRSPMATPRK
ncbi:leucine-rich repeat-containing protein 45-like [Amphiura filiformis]|uniref:leucine-rich repeat-containing protein 45-like n=1 Tax=Amphiura filiformis TaxID=82378 RepID=UPI003B223A60